MVSRHSHYIRGDGEDTEHRVGHGPPGHSRRAFERQREFQRVQARAGAQTGVPVLSFSYAAVCAALAGAILAATIFSGGALAQSGGFSPSELEGASGEAAASGEEGTPDEPTQDTSLSADEGEGYAEPTTGLEVSAPEATTAAAGSGGQQTPGYLSQTGGPEQIGPGIIVPALALAAGATLVTLVLTSRRVPLRQASAVAAGSEQAETDAKEAEPSPGAAEAGRSRGFVSAFASGLSRIRDTLPGAVAVTRRRIDRNRGIGRRSGSDEQRRRR